VAQYSTAVERIGASAAAESTRPRQLHTPVRRRATPLNRLSSRRWRVAVSRGRQVTWPAAGTGRRCGRRSRIGSWAAGNCGPLSLRPPGARAWGQGSGPLISHRW